MASNGNAIRSQQLLPLVTPRVIHYTAFMPSRFLSPEALQAWTPPVFLYAAGRDSANHPRYRHDASVKSSPRRILIKRTRSGTGTLYVGGRRHVVPAGWAFVIERPGPYLYCYEAAPEAWRFEFATIGFGGFRDAGALLPEWLQRDPLIALQDFPQLDEQFSQLVDVRLGSGQADDLLHSALAYRFFLDYVAARSKSALAGDRHPAARCRLTIERRFTEPLMIRELAEEVGYAPESLTRTFHQRYGVTPRHYVNVLRVRMACRLLESGGLPLKTVARKCGFSSPHYFGRTFRQFLGVSPGAYRKAPDPLRLDALK